MSRPAKFITLEGIEGVGKSTLSRLVVNYLITQLQVSVVQTREPGGTPLAERIRDLTIETTSERVFPDTELLLMFAARAQHLHQVILPALEQNTWVVSDRFVDATYAYQGAGRGLESHKIAVLEKLVLGDFKPDLVILLDAPVELGMRRASRRGALDRFESEELAFFERVREAYLNRAQANPSRYLVIDAAQDLLEVQAQLTSSLETWLKSS